MTNQDVHTYPQLTPGNIPFGSQSGNITQDANFTFNEVTQVFSAPILRTNDGSLLNVKSFGAKGDSSTDDTVAIQNAIAAAQLAGSGVYFPAGSYVHTGLAVTGQVSLYGDGSGASLLLGPTGADNLALNVGGGSRVFNITIRGLALGFKANQTMGAALHIGNVGSLRLRDVTIGSGSGGTPNVGLLAEDGAQVSSSGLWISGCSSHGVQFAPLTGKDMVDFWFADDCIINSNGGDGLRFRSDTTGIIEGIHLGACSVYNNAGNGITIFKNSTGAVKNFHLWGTIIDSNKGIGLTADATAGQAITNLFLDWVAVSANTAISVVPSGPFNDGIFIGAVQDYHIDGGNCSVNGKSGIQVSGASNGKISNVTMYDNNQGVGTALSVQTYAINVAGTTQFLKILGCQIYNETARSETLQNGITIASTALDVEVSGNYLPHLSGATPFTDNTDGTKRIQEWGNRTVGSNSDEVGRARGWQVDTKSGGTLRDTLRFFEAGSAKNFYMRCSSSGDLEFVNSAFNAIIGAIDANGHPYKKQAAVPTYAAGTGAGTSPTTPAMTGTDMASVVTLTTGTSPATNATIFTVTFNGAFSIAPNTVEVVPMNAAAAALSGATQPFVSATSTTTFTFTSNATGLAATTAYKWAFVPAV